MSDVKCRIFKCEDLSKYTDSMLFDKGEVIAAGIYHYKDQIVCVTLEVAGDAAVTFKDEVYHRPSEFPDELVERIRKNPNDWEYYAPSGEGNDNAEGDVYIGLNNWFEYVYTTVDGTSDGIVYEKDLSKAAKEDIKEDVEQIARMCFGLDSCYDAGAKACLDHSINCA